MSPDPCSYPVAVSQLVMPSDSRDAQNLRAIRWLLDQPGGPVVVVTPQRRFTSDAIERLLKVPGASHLTWRGLSIGSFTGRRVLHAWPNREELNDLWGADADALAVIEWNVAQTVEWIEDAQAVRLLPDGVGHPPVKPASTSLGPLPNGVDEILDYIAMMAAGYDSGLKWNEEDKLRADMMNRPERWAPITVEQLRAACRARGIRPGDVDKITGFLQRRKEGRRFNVRSSYRDYQFG